MAMTLHSWLKMKMTYNNLSNWCWTNHLTMDLDKTKILHIPQFGGFHYKSFTLLYISLVVSILDYGACLWGHQQYSPINLVQNYAMHFFLGCH